jgi:predicted DCC family thiol-disulfide oxidoreductase YuxK
MKRVKVHYDDECALCRCQVRVLARLDWLKRLVWVPVSVLDPARVPASVSHADLLRAIHCVGPGERVYSGARCFRHLGMRIPLLVPISLLLWIPGVIWVADRIYERVSRNRHRLSRLVGCENACAGSAGGTGTGEGERRGERELQ